MTAHEPPVTAEVITLAAVDGVRMTSGGRDIVLVRIARECRFDLRVYVDADRGLIYQTGLGVPDHPAAAARSRSSEDTAAPLALPDVE